MSSGLPPAVTTARTSVPVPVAAALVASLLVASPAAAVGILVRSAPPPPPGGGRYAGPAACIACHEAQHRFQAARRHARALESLSGPSSADPVCLRCHATGYGYAGGYGPGGGDASLAGVTCEACHGPCGDHVDSRAKTATALGDCPDCLKGKVCLPCHTAERDPAFDLPEALKRAGCPRD